MTTGSDSVLLEDDRIHRTGEVDNLFFYSLLECFVVLWRPVVVLGLGAELALLVGEVRAHGVDLHEGPEHGVGLPAEVVHAHHWRERSGVRR